MGWLFAALAQAQSFPAKPIRVVVPYTAGGPADLLVRALGQKLTDAWGQQVIVENKPGANEIIAAQDIAKSPADGYNYLLASDAVYLAQPLSLLASCRTTRSRISRRWHASSPRT